MSEAASAGASAGGTSTASAAPSAPTSVTPSQATNEGQQSSGNTEAKTTTATTSKAGESNAEADFEEIKVGSVTGKVPKQIAAMIKNLERGFHTKSQEASQKEKLLSLAKSNPREFFKQTGQSVDDFAEEVLAQKYELMAMSPEQRELKQLKEQQAEREKTEKASRQEVIDRIKSEFGGIPDGAENATREQLIQYYRHQQQVYANTQSTLDKEMGEAFKESGLSPDKHLLAKVAFEMSSALKRGKSLSAKDAIAKVSNEYYSGAKETFGKMDVKRIHEIFGDEFLDKIRKYDLDQVTGNAASKFGQTNQSPGYKPASEAPKKYVNQAEYRKIMGIS